MRRNMNDDSGRLQELKEKKEKIGLTHAEAREMKKLEKARKSGCMCMGLSNPIIVHGGKK